MTKFIFASTLDSRRTGAYVDSVIKSFWCVYFVIKSTNRSATLIQYANCEFYRVDWITIQQTTECGLLRSA